MRESRHGIYSIPKIRVAILAEHLFCSFVNLTYNLVKLRESTTYLELRSGFLWMTNLLVQTTSYPLSCNDLLVLRFIFMGHILTRIISLWFHVSYEEPLIYKFVCNDKQNNIYLLTLFTYKSFINLDNAMYDCLVINSAYTRARSTINIHLSSKSEGDIIVL